MPPLTIFDHRRDSAGLLYVYPVLSRRSGGLSIGINLNPNNACNWACRYCQVPNLQRGSGPLIDLERLEVEFRSLLEEVASGEFFERHGLPKDQCAIRDIALSGNGEPTSSKELPKVIGLIGRILAEYDLLGKIKLVLISNGSLMRRDKVQQALAHWGELGGEIWFKLDSATTEGMAAINLIQMTPQTILENLKAAARLCPTFIQTCVVAIEGVAVDIGAVPDLSPLLSPRLPGTRVITLFGVISTLGPGALAPAISPLATGDLLLVSANLLPERPGGRDDVMAQYDNPPTRAWLSMVLAEIGIHEAGDIAFRWDNAPDGPMIVGEVTPAHAVMAQVEGVTVGLPAGDPIRVLESFRHSPETLEALLLQEGLEVLQINVSPSGEEGVAVCRRAP